jgi:hypothetical protein
MSNKFFTSIASTLAMDSLDPLGTIVPFQIFQPKPGEFPRIRVAGASPTAFQFDASDPVVMERLRSSFLHSQSHRTHGKPSKEYRSDAIREAAEASYEDLRIAAMQSLIHRFTRARSAIEMEFHCAVLDRAVQIREAGVVAGPDGVNTSVTFIGGNRHKDLHNIPWLETLSSRLLLADSSDVARYEDNPEMLNFEAEERLYAANYQRQRVHGAVWLPSATSGWSYYDTTVCLFGTEDLVNTKVLWSKTGRAYAGVGLPDPVAQPIACSPLDAIDAWAALSKPWLNDNKVDPYRFSRIHAALFSPAFSTSKQPTA